MLSAETENLLKETISHLKGEHFAERDKALREFKFKMVNQGISRSSMFNQGKAKMYYDVFEKYANGAWHKMQRVLEQIGFDAYPGCEKDLIAFLKGSLSDAYEDHKGNLVALEKVGAHMPKTTFDVHYSAVLGKLETEVKIFAKKLQAMKEKEKAEAITQNNYYLHGPSSRVNIGSTDNSNNIISESELFPKLREAVEAQVSDSDTKARLLKKLKEGEGLPKKSPIFNNWFTQFLALAADCITVVQPFVPALTQLLTQANT